LLERGNRSRASAGWCCAEVLRCGRACDDKGVSTALRAQLADELHLRLVLPTASLLGLDLPDMVEARLEARADILAAQLGSPDDDERARR